jgi:hypothetical protein
MNGLCPSAASTLEHRHRSRCLKPLTCIGPWCFGTRAQVGLRTVEVVQEPVEGSQGLSFYFQVNGVPMFAKGANMIPLDIFVNNVTDSVRES